MARKRITENKAKGLLLDYLALPYQGREVVGDDRSSLEELDRSLHFVVKVDQGIKKRFKLGLVALDVSVDELPQKIKQLQEKGYSQFIIEPYQTHEDHQERYLAIQRTREGFVFLISTKGGVTIEDHSYSLQSFPQNEASQAAKILGVTAEFLEKILAAMDKYHFSFLEINPLVVQGENIFLLDLAVEVDSAGTFFVQDAWNEKDFVSELAGKTKEEVAVEELSSKSQASFRLVVLNPNGSIFMLLSGGGASIVLADEVYNRGLGQELANYGEYSGNPNAQETYLYTKQILSLLLSSKAKKKSLIIAGGVANFTDIRITFRGIIQALTEVESEMQKQHVKVFVRRGGPYQEEGLAMMKEYLEKADIMGEVHGPEMVLTDIVVKSLQEVNN